MHRADADESDHGQDEELFGVEAVELNSTAVRSVGGVGPRGLAAFAPARTNSSLRRQLQETESVDGSEDGEDGDDLAFDAGQAEQTRKKRMAKRL